MPARSGGAAMGAVECFAVLQRGLQTRALQPPVPHQHTVSCGADWRGQRSAGFTVRISRGFASVEPLDGGFQHLRTAVYGTSGRTGCLHPLPCRPIGLDRSTTHRHMLLGKWRMALEWLGGAEQHLWVAHCWQRSIGTAQPASSAHANRSVYASRNSGSAPSAHTCLHRSPDLHFELL